MRRLTIATGLLLGIGSLSLPLLELPPELRLLLNGLLAGCLLAVAATNLLLLHLYRQPLNLLLALPVLPLLTGMLQGWPDPGQPDTSLLCGLLLTLLTPLSQYQGQRLQHLRRQQELQRYRQSLQTAEERGRTTFMARINHEIRTPLNGVLGMTELLLATPLSPRQRDYVQTIHSSGGELLQLLNELLDVSGVPPTEQPPQSVPFDLAALVHECCETARSQFELRKVMLRSQIPSGLSHECHGDPGRLRQILSRLLEQALQRSQEQDQVLLELLVGGDANAQQLCLNVQDSGRSLSAREREQLLGMPPAADGSLRELSDLRLCRQLSEALRGTLALTTPSGGGLRVQICLPIDCTPTLLHDPQLLSGARVMVVDASATGRSATAQLCNSWSMQTQEADCQSAAIAILRAQASIGQPVDVVLIDRDLPEGALDLASRIRSMPAADDVLLLLCGQSGSLMEARSAGINRVLPRPLSGYTLRATLEEELTRIRNSQQKGAERPPRMPPDFSILVVEDDAISAKVIQGLLAKLNITPELAIDGQQALDAMARRRYDLILMDCEMPVLDGFSATTRQREREQQDGTPRQPIVALSAHVLDDQRERMRKAGMDGQLAKPIELPQLYRVLEQRVAQRQQASG